MGYDPERSEVLFEFELLAVPLAGFERALTAPEGNAVHGPDLVNAPPAARWGAYGGAQGTNPAVPGGALPPVGVSAGHPLRDACPGSILPAVDLTGARVTRAEPPLGAFVGPILVLLTSRA